MRVDRASLVELGLLPDAADVWPLSSLLDHTHARPAREALKRLLAEPLTTASEILARQRLLPALHRELGAIPWREVHANATKVEQALSSNFILAPISQMRMAAFAVSHKNIVQFAAQLAADVHRLLEGMRALSSRLAALEGDAAFNRLRDEIVAIVDDPRGRVVSDRVRQGGLWRMATCDAIVRGDSAPDEISYRDQLRALSKAVSQLDAWCSLAEASSLVRGTPPTLVARDGALQLTELRHPLLPDGVANDVRFDSNDRVCFLTGPNMAGKSTALRATGLAVCFAHLGMVVPAGEATVPVFDRLVVSIAVQDNLDRHESLFLAEVRRVKRVVEAVTRGESVCAIVDEVFRGTNVKDAGQATGLLVDGLARAPHGSFIIASHLAEVGSARVSSTGVACRFMDATVDGESYRFTYRMRDGVSDVHLGMRLLDAEGVGGMLRALAAQS